MKKMLPTIAKNGYKLLSGVKLHNLYPSTFAIPSEEDKARLKKGSLVKLMFEINIGAPGKAVDPVSERMWVIVTERDGEWFSGFLDNQPLSGDAMKLGMVVNFKSEHIIDIGEDADLESEHVRRYERKAKKRLLN
jgi:uncharacterized protein DUF2314